MEDDKMKKPIDFTKVNFLTYATETYLKDIPAYDLVSCYVSLFEWDSGVYQGDFEHNGVSKHVVVNTKTNQCFVDGELMDMEEFLMFFEQEEEVNEIIKNITGIDLDDYITEIDYEDGTVEIREVKGQFKVDGLVDTKYLK